MPCGAGRGRVADLDAQEAAVHAGREGKALLSGVAAGLGGIVEEVSEGDDHVGVADARLRGDADLQLQGIALRAQLLRAGEEKGVDNGVLARAEIGAEAAGLRDLGGIGGCLVILPLCSRSCMV